MPSPSRVLVGIVILVTSCGGRGLPIEMPPGLRAADLRALAVEIDPGELPPLRSMAPRWLGIPEHVDPNKTLALGGQLGACTTIVQLEKFIALLRGLLALEGGDQSRCDLQCLAVRGRLYNLLDVPFLSDPDNFFGQLVQLFRMALGSRLSNAQLDELFTFVRAAMRGAAPRHRHVVAAILRRAPESPEATDALRRLARRAVDDEDYDLGRKLWATVAARERPLTRDTHLALAAACYHVLDLSCGDRLLAALDDDGKPEHRKELEGHRETGSFARRLAALDRPRTYEQRLEHAGLEVRLGHNKQARKAVDALRAEHPDDARPLDWLAELAIARLHFDEARRHIEAARPLEHKDGHFYALAIGTWFSEFMQTIMPAMMQEAARKTDDDKAGARIVELLRPRLAPLKADLVQLAHYDRAHADVISAMVDGAEQLLPLAGIKDEALQDKRLRQQLARTLATARALLARWPDLVDARLFALMTARLVDDGALVRRWAEASPPRALASEPRLAQLRASVLYSLALARADLALLASARKLAEARTGDLKTDRILEEIEAGSLAVQARAGSDRRRWKEVEARYRSLLANADAQDTPRLKNNLGVALAAQGRTDDALTEWRAAGGETGAARLNWIVARPDATADERLACMGGLWPVAYQAAAWRIDLAGSSPKRIADRTDARTQMEKSARIGGVVDGSLGVILEQSFTVGFGYSSTLGIITQFELPMKTWLILPAPSTVRR